MDPVKANILIINGPNLNLLLRRQPEIYGNRSMEQIMLDIQRQHMDVAFTYRQSNHEGDLIDWIQQAEGYTALILNAGGYTHTSVALRDAVELCLVPVIEVHLSHIHQREKFRQQSLLGEVCVNSIYGIDCYEKAVDYTMSRYC